MRMQSALNAMYVRKNGVCASSVRFYGDARDLVKPLEFGTDVGNDGVLEADL